MYGRNVVNFPVNENIRKEDKTTRLQEIVVDWTIVGIIDQKYMLKFNFLPNFCIC